MYDKKAFLFKQVFNQTIDLKRRCILQVLQGIKQPRETNNQEKQTTKRSKRNKQKRIKS